MGENNNSGASRRRGQPDTPQCPSPSLLSSVPPNTVQGGAHGDHCAPPPSSPSGPAPRVLFCLRPLARARPPWKTGKRPFPRARLPRTAEKARERVRRGEAGDGQQRSGILQPAAHTRPPAPLTRAHSREERTFALVPRRHSPKETTEGRTETRRTKLRQARAKVAQPRTAIPGTARRDSLPTREAAAGASAGERRERAVRAGGHHLASTPPAPIYSPFRAPRDLPNLAPARSPASDMTQPQAGPARLAG